MGLEQNLPYEPIRMKELAIECDISQGEAALALNASKSTICHCFNRGYVPVRRKKTWKKDVEEFLLNQAGVCAWLIEKKLKPADLWKPAEQTLRQVKPSGMGDRQRKGRYKAPAVITGNPDSIDSLKEVSMLTDGARKQFRLFRHPFIDDILKDSDIFMSDEHRYIEAAMLDAARHGGFLAIIGEVGSGKSVMRRKVIEQLKRSGDVLVIYPQIIDKQRVTAGSLCDAIIMDISNEKPLMKLESKSRQVQRLLKDRCQNGFRHVLIIEEAHDLSIPVLKYLKRFHELEDGYKKMLGIVMVAQTELKNSFNESQNVDMREVIQRVQIAEIRGLNGSLRDYLKVKFERLGCKLDSVFAADAYDMLTRRLTSEDDNRRQVSLAHPLRVNEMVIRAINLAHEMGEDLVTADVIEAI